MVLPVPSYGPAHKTPDRPIAPPTGDDPHLLEAVENFAVEQFVTQAGVEALDIAVLPWAARLDVEGGNAQPAQPFSHDIGHKFGAIIGPDMLRRAMLNEQIGQRVDHVVRPETAERYHGQAFAAELVADGEHPELAPVMGLILDKIVGPDMPAILWAQPDARPVAQPEAATFRFRPSDAARRHRPSRDDAASNGADPEHGRSAAPIQAGCDGPARSPRGDGRGSEI